MCTIKISNLLPFSFPKNGEMVANAPTGLYIKNKIVKSELLEGENIMTWEVENQLLPENLVPDEVSKYPLDKVELTKRIEFNNESNDCLFFRLFLDQNQPNTEITRSDLLNFNLDHYGTFFDKLRSFYITGMNAVYINNPVYKVYNCFEDALSTVSIVVIEDEIIGYLIKDYNCGEDDFPNFYFKNDKLCEDILLEFLEDIIVQPIDGGKEYNLRDIFDISDNELKVFINEFTMIEVCLSKRSIAKDLTTGKMF